MTMYASKTLAERNNDPQPYVTKDLGFRFPYSSLLHPCDLDPRPQYQHGKLEANPILVELRGMRGADWARPERYPAQAKTYLRWIDQEDASCEDPEPWTAEQRAHAHRVLTLWLAVFA